MKFLILFILLLCSCYLTAQKYDNTWLIGEGYYNFANNQYEKTYQLTFNHIGIQQDTIRRNMETRATSASICDTAGNLQFYTNGIFINDHSHQLMENGDSLGDTD